MAKDAARGQRVLGMKSRPNGGFRCSHFLLSIFKYVKSDDGTGWRSFPNLARHCSVDMPVWNRGLLSCERTDFPAFEVAQKGRGSYELMMIYLFFTNLLYHISSLSIGGPIQTSVFCTVKSVAWLVCRFVAEWLFGRDRPSIDCRELEAATSLR